MARTKSTAAGGGGSTICELIIAVRFVGLNPTYLIRSLLDVGASLTRLPRLCGPSWDWFRANVSICKSPPAWVSGSQNYTC